MNLLGGNSVGNQFLGEINGVVTFFDSIFRNVFLLGFLYNWDNKLMNTIKRTLIHNDFYSKFFASNILLTLIA